MFLLSSLVLHSNDNAVDYRSETRDASRAALEKTLDIFALSSSMTPSDPHLERARAMLKAVREEEESNQGQTKPPKQLNYLEMLREICRYVIHNGPEISKGASI